MPSNITVKKADGTTDITYAAFTGASANSPAVWRANVGGDSAGSAAELRVASGPSGTPVSGRKVPIQFSFPQVVTDADGIVRVIGRLNFTGTVQCASNVADATKTEAAAQLGNLLASSTVKAAMASGFAPV